MPVIEQYLQTINKDFCIIKSLKGQLLKVVTSAPMLESKKIYVHDTLETLFNGIDLSQSFEKPLVIIYDEVMTAEILILIHQWLRSKCCDIENFTLILTHTDGLKCWWEQWCKVNFEKSFKIIELPFGYASTQNFYNLDSLPSVDTIYKQKNIKHFFSFYGGTYPTTDKMYLILKVLELSSHGIIEYIGNFTSKEEILSYIEYLTYFKNHKEVQNISVLYDKYVVDNKLKPLHSVDTVMIKNERFFDSHQWIVDAQCFANIVRESNNDQPFISLTEKTFRSFVHHLAVIPAGYLAVKHLENKGFWFPHDIIDYSYQHEQDYHLRIHLMVESVKRTISNKTLDNLTKYYHDNLQKFHNNAELAYNLLYKDYFLKE